MCFPACNVAYAQEAVLLDGIQDSIPEKFSETHARTELRFSQKMPSGYAPPAIAVRSDVHAGYQSQIPSLSSEELQLKKVLCFQNTGGFRKW